MIDWKHSVAASGKARADGPPVALRPLAGRDGGSAGPVARPTCGLDRRSVAAGLVLLLATGLSTAIRVEAGKYNQVLDIGDKAPAWSDLPGVDGHRHSLGDLHDRRAVVVVFTCNTCPYAVDVEDRLISLTEDYRPREVAVVAINVNKVPEDRLPAMKRRAEKKSFNFTYLFDESQQIAKDYGAKYTPQFFVLDEDRRVAYMGSLDDSPGGDDVSERYVADALEAVLAGDRPEVTETVPIGCRIRIERDRRRR
jgi:peroxiredoxin